MLTPPVPPNEAERLAALRALHVLDTPPEPHYDSITQHLTALWDAPIAAISLVDEHRQWFKSEVGLGVRETPRDVSFCAHLMTAPDQPLVVPDAMTDARFADNPLVLGQPQIRFYAGAPLRDDRGRLLGALCVIDRKPRQPTPAQMEALRHMATTVSGALVMQRAVHQLSRLATLDPLTGVQNRQGLDRAAAAREGAAMTVLVLDLDGFKAINDTHGHAAGDAALVETAQRLQHSVRRADIVGRLGGDEFVIIQPAVGDPILGHRITARIHRELARPMVHAGAPISLRASIGLAWRTDGALPYAELLRRADAAMYANKQEARRRRAWSAEAHSGASVVPLPVRLADLDPAPDSAQLSAS